MIEFILVGRNNMLQECDCCHEEFPVLEIVFDGKFFYCHDCVSGLSNVDKNIKVLTNDE